MPFSAVAIEDGGDINEEIGLFLNQNPVKTFDCPSDYVSTNVNRFLRSANLSDEFEASLKLIQTHYQICQGKYVEAKDTVEMLLSNGDVAQSSRNYSYALYQLGFILDVDGSPDDCRYYQKADRLAKNRFDDIALSAQLSILTECSTTLPLAEKLGKLYALLESFTKKGDPAAIAHIHNSIGLYYSSIGQEVLAGEQYLKAYELGLKHYNSSNLLSTLVSVITSKYATRKYDKAWELLEEYRRVNRKVNTPLSNSWLFLAESGYYYRTADFDALRKSLARWEVFLPQIQSARHRALYQWYKAGVCLNDKNVACVNDYLTLYESYGANSPIPNTNKDHLKMIMDIHLFLGDIESSKAAFDRFSDVMFSNAVKLQEAGKILGVAQLHSQVLALEQDLIATQRERQATLFKYAIVMLLIVLILSVYLRKKYFEQIRIEKFGREINSKKAITEIKSVPRADHEKTNALALLDLKKFKDEAKELEFILTQNMMSKIIGTLSNVTRDNDIVARISEQQFLICLVNIEERTAPQFFERIQRALESTLANALQHSVDVGKLNLSTSLSIYLSTESFDDIDDILDDLKVSLDKSFSVA
ncbi:GGDEF domain-containing protein [Aestuariibacter sp. AA17]|uniref:GGDEF domain-containing protein n=1 Tax=Fluctibacter corallii TaxID=2984329 RepID=A0ABT3A9C6_9ALTE|nr:GGDEF domain-containing protein [Aestuariibacter sp. AA17]MCV2885280.1 GGDEF domain-containing protein [Aestuariibacter sp. AA17]